MKDSGPQAVRLQESKGTFVEALIGTLLGTLIGALVRNPYRSCKVPGVGVYFQSRVRVLYVQA